MTVQQNPVAIGTQVESKTAPSDVTYRAPLPEDCPALSQMAAASFAATFADVVDPVEMPTYLEKAYGPAGDMLRDLRDPEISWQAAFVDGQPVGYVKLSGATLPGASSGAATEVRQLYVAEGAKGTGIADHLMRWAIEMSLERQAAEILLAVFDHNHRAVRFYVRHGFERIGTVTFWTGTQAHEDGVWQLKL